jgi:hypothetical protein
VVSEFLIVVFFVRFTRMDGRRRGTVGRGGRDRHVGRRGRRHGCRRFRSQFQQRIEQRRRRWIEQQQLVGRGRRRRLVNL